MQIVSKGLKFTYNKKTEFKRQALNGVDLIIEEGDFFGIIGQTGSGKSTFIQHLNGLIPVEEGTLLVGNYDLSLGKKIDKNILKTLRSKVGMVFQYPEYQLFAETVYEDVAFGVRNFFPNIEEDEIALKVKNALELVGLNFYEVKDKSPFEMSGGQKRRVAIAGILVTEPEVLVLDEPVAGLDPVGKTKLMELLHSLHSTTVKTIVIVSHDMDEVLENCNRVAVFSDGVAVKVDKTANLFSDSEFLVKNNLELPLSVKLVNALKDVGVEVSTDFKLNDLINKISEKYNK